ncbi:hypothetical protein ES702_06725 [subsurface metagenome]
MVVFWWDFKAGFPVLIVVTPDPFLGSQNKHE